MTFQQLDERLTDRISDALGSPWFPMLFFGTLLAIHLAQGHSVFSGGSAVLIVFALFYIWLRNRAS